MPANQMECLQSFGWHLLSKMVVIAAAAVYFPTAQARANIMEFAVIQELSFLKSSTKLVGPALGGSKQGVPQYVGSDVTSYFGRMYVDINDTTIQLLTTSYISAAGRVGGARSPFLVAPGDGGVRGLFAPFDPVEATSPDPPFDYEDRPPSSATP